MSGLSSSDAACLERFNRSAARLITRTSPSSDISRELLLARAGLPSLGTRRRMAQCLLISLSRTPSSAPSASPFNMGIAWQAETIATEKSPTDTCSAPKQIFFQTFAALSSSHHLEQTCCRYSKQRPPFGPGHFKLFWPITVCTCVLLFFSHTRT